MNDFERRSLWLSTTSARSNRRSSLDALGQVDDIVVGAGVWSCGAGSRSGDATLDVDGASVPSDRR